MRNSSKQTITASLLIIICLMIGFTLGFYFYTSQSSNMVKMKRGNNKINTIIKIIDKSYVDTVNINELIDKASASLVKELDPHSVLIPAKDLQAVTEDLEGSFSGIGVTFNMPSDTILVISVVSGGPAEKAGINPFDRIITINDSVFAGKKIDQNEIMKTLRGEKKSKVKLGIQRGTTAELIHIDVTRGDVPVHSIDVSYAIKEGIGYIMVSRIGKNTYNEFITAIAKLKEAGCSGFIIDLRGNTGGYLDTAIRMINEFMPRNSPIVYVEGKAYPRNEASADGTGSCIDAPLVIIIDEGSGSASEIFAGAVQDNDRGLIIGRRSFGKGLVQAPIMLNDGSELRLTIARYYTPSGRSIQKLYELGKTEEYEKDIYNRYMHGEFDSADSINLSESPRYQTLLGRTVYGGGGIMPDLFIPRDTSKITSYYSMVINKGILYQFTINYSERHHKQLASFDNYQALYRHLQQQPLLEEFVRFAETHNIKRRSKLIEISRRLLENNLRAYIVRNFFDNNGFYPIFQQEDITLKTAVQLIEEGKWKPTAPENAAETDENKTNPS